MTDEDTFEERTRALDEEQPPVAEEIFWKTRPVFEHLRDFARARRVSPWAVLGVTLARVVAATKPFIQLPPLRGSYASLNLFIGLVGPSGSGKDAATKVARDALEVPRILTVPLGSGEGLSHMFMKETKNGAEQYNDTVLVTVGEIDTMTALQKRQASTVMAQLRQAAMGEQLGFFYVDTAKRMMVPEHSYRLCLVAGIQPLRAAALLEDSDGGTPQRFVWLPATDPDAPDIAPPCPDPMLWESPPWHHIVGVHVGGMDRVVINVCQAAIDTIVAITLANARGESTEALDGHAALTRLKVATALALLQGRGEVTDDDWELSGTVMAVSDKTRTGVIETLAADNRSRNHQQAEADVARKILTDDRVAEHGVKRVGAAIRRKLERADGQWVSRADLRRGISGTSRDYFATALERLLDVGVIQSDATHRDDSGHGGTGQRYRLIRDAK